jgi:DNA-binding SARP family transcriptional activator/tetratricopeptide (TPR) repeat protein
MLRDGDPHGAAAVLAGAPIAVVDSLDLAEVRALLARIGSAVEEVPGLLLTFARMLELTVQFSERAATLDRLERIAGLRRDDALLRAVNAERARDLAANGQADEAIALADEVIAGVAGGELLVRARAQAARGRAYSFRRLPGDAVRAADELRDAAALLRQLEEPIAEAHTLIWLGYGTLMPEGRDRQALPALRRAMAVAPRGSRVHEIALGFLISSLLEAGRPDEAAPLLDVVEAAAAERNDSRVLGYAAWNRATLATLRNEGAALPALLGAVERYQSDWFEHPTGAEFLAAASDMAQRLGNEPLARAYLERAEERAAEHGFPEIAAAARAGFEARFGDAVQAGRLLSVAGADPQVARRDRWRLQALRGLAADRAGDLEEAQALAAGAVEEAHSLGLSHLVAMVEPVFSPALLSLAVGGGSATARRIRHSLRLTPAMSIQLLGRFRVTVDGEERTPTGQPATLVKIVALAGGQLPAEHVIETLWPEEDPDTGRRRLRNLLNRLTSMSGPIVDRQGDLLRVPGSIDVSAVEVDLATVRAGGPEAHAAARRALDGAAGPLLADEPYADWAVMPRERLHHELALAADLLCSEAQSARDLHAATNWLERALVLDPWGLERHERSVRLALAAGDDDHARFVARRAQKAYDDLSLPLPAAIADVLSD